MKSLYILLPVLLFSCVRTEKKIVKEVVYQTDTIYIELEDTSTKPWELECLDTAYTTLDMNVCSLDCFLVADSVLEVRYDNIIAYYNKGINGSEGMDYAKRCKIQKKRFQTFHNDFLKMRDTMEEMVSTAFEGIRFSPLYVNSYTLGMTEDQIELYENFHEVMDTR
ncbi:hypothetical protein K6119_04355 [Paracrocinitomix mangrovi]|uniref:hypothetical protein n=1 Tax=Paracrocinitomix mangrovi TaxID=2862509 RepID=UPI001C8EC11E|nr:hypothetical protein [Paracrocinitomix mangrovi]UKN02746.1 hypothetical protein K6119_04355 [Paracrocinitomix mangrovi]